jgi:hypothetical protein
MLMHMRFVLALVLYARGSVSFDSNHRRCHVTDINPMAFTEIDLLSHTRSPNEGLCLQSAQMCEC